MCKGCMGQMELPIRDPKGNVPEGVNNNLAQFLAKCNYRQVYTKGVEMRQRHARVTYLSDGDEGKHDPRIS
jgi:hypothetical protein